MLPDGSVGCGAELGAVAVPVDGVGRSVDAVLRRPRHVDDVDTVERDVTQAAAVRREVTEVHLAVRAADEYEPVDVELAVAATTELNILSRVNTSN